MSSKIILYGIMYIACYYDTLLMIDDDDDDDGYLLRMCTVQL